MMRSFLLITAVAAVLFCTSCSMLIRQDPPLRQKQENGAPAAAEPAKEGPAVSGKSSGQGFLTARQVEEMSPDELERHLEERRRKESARALSDDLASGKLTEKDRRRMRSNVTRPLTPEERGSAFPWKSEPGLRSETLRDTTTFGH